MLDGDESDDGWDADRRPLSRGEFGTAQCSNFPQHSFFFFLLTRRAQLDPSRAIMDLSRILPP